MARDRIAACKFYECKGVCAKGRKADYTGYCQTCDKYVPAPIAPMAFINRKKEKLDKIRKKEMREQINGN